MSMRIAVSSSIVIGAMALGAFGYTLWMGREPPAPEPAEPPPKLIEMWHMPTQTPVPEHMAAVRAACIHARTQDTYSVVVRSTSLINIEVAVAGDKWFAKRWIPGQPPLTFTTGGTDGEPLDDVSQYIGTAGAFCVEPRDIRFVHEVYVGGVLADEYVMYVKETPETGTAWNYWISKAGLLLKASRKRDIQRSDGIEEVKEYIIDIGTADDMFNMPPFESGPAEGDMPRFDLFNGLLSDTGAPGEVGLGITWPPPGYGGAKPPTPTP